MRWLRFTILLVVVTLLNVHSVMDMAKIGPLNIRPDLLLILLVFSAINCNIHDTIAVAFLIGFAADISGHAMGPSTIVFGVMGSMISLVRQVVIMKRMIHQGLAVFVVGLISGLLIQVLTLLKTGQAASPLFSVVFKTSLYSAIVAPFFWLLLSVLSGWYGAKHTSARS